MKNLHVSAITEEKIVETVTRVKQQIKLDTYFGLTNMYSYRKFIYRPYSFCRKS